MYEVDFLPVEAADGPSEKSGDAITVRFTRAQDDSQRVMVIDAGFSDVGQDVVDHVGKYYGTTHVDLVVSTHPDTDHLNGLKTVVEQLDVDELLIHQPRLHTHSLGNFTNLDAVDELIATAKKHGTKVTEPFTGLSRFEDQVLILGPSESFYESKLAEQLDEGNKLRAALERHLAASSLVSTNATDPLSKTQTWYPPETLDEGGETSPRNETSVVMLLRCDERRLLFTGDTGLEGLGQAADHYESMVGPFPYFPLNLFQIPHHGSRRNLSPSLLDRILGTEDNPFASTSAIASSAKANLKHPSPKVTNAIGRRGVTALATEGKSICSHHNGPARIGWGPVKPIGPLVEDADD